MNKNILILFLSLSFSQFMIGQNTFFIGKKTYPCSDNFKFRVNYYYINVLFVKSGDAGLIVLSKNDDNHDPMARVIIKGTILIYLEDNTVISCIDRGEYDNVNDNSSTIYHLTKDEINKMKNSNVKSIRFTLKCYQCIDSSEEGNFIADNVDNTDILKPVVTDISGILNKLFESAYNRSIKQLDLDNLQEYKGVEYYKSKGYQVSRKYNFGIICPCQLEDGSSLNSGNFDFNFICYNKYSNNKLSFYQILVRNLPVGYFQLNNGEKQNLENEYLNKFYNDPSLTSSKKAIFKNSNSIISTYTVNGSNGKAVIFIRNGKIYSLNLITNDSLDFKFNTFANSIVFFDNQ